MSWESIAKPVAVIAGALGLVQLVQSVRPRQTRRAEIKSSLEILALLPPDSGARESLVRHVDERVAQMIRLEDVEVYNLGHVASGVYLALASLGFFLWYPTWWVAALATPFLALGVWILWDGAQRSVRDDQGLRTKDLPAAGSTEAPQPTPESILER